MAYNEPAKANLVGYAPNDQASYNTQTGVTIKPDAYYDMMLLKMLRQMEFHYAKYAIQKTLPKNYGDTINWRRFKKLEVAADLGRLVEGETPAGKEGISGEAITAVIHQYGEVMYFTDLVDIQQLDDVRREYTIELGYIAQETLDTIVRNTLVNEGSAYFAKGTAITELVDAEDAGLVRPKIDDFRKIILGFKKDFVTGIRGAAGRYVALISPEVMFALFDDKRMLQYMSFGQTNAPLQDGVAVDMFGIRFEEVLNAPVLSGGTGAGAWTAHDSIVLADEAYAITKLAGEGNVRVITKGLGSAGVSDPLDQRQSIGYKITGFSAKVLRPESVVNYWSNPLAVVSAANAVDVNKTLSVKAERATGVYKVAFTDGEETPNESVVFAPASDNIADAFALTDGLVIAEAGVPVFTVGGKTLSGALPLAQIENIFADIVALDANGVVEISITVA